MGADKHLLDAETFHRRRLVAAFVSGAPGGREAEPCRPIRAIVGGLVVALLLVAGAAASKVLTDARRGEPDAQVGASWTNARPGA